MFVIGVAFFCHEEGDMKYIDPITVNDNLYECLSTLSETLHIKKIMLTGGEPFAHPRFDFLLGSVNQIFDKVQLTSNGTIPVSEEKWEIYKNTGLDKVTISIHNTEAEGFLALETKNRTLAWAERSLGNQFDNLRKISDVGIPLRVNVVVHGDYKEMSKILSSLLDLQSHLNLEIRLLNDLENILESQHIISRLIKDARAILLSSNRRGGSSNTTDFYQAASGKKISVKISYPYFLPAVCQGCPIRAENKCHEGFYGVRLEERLSELYVRLCIYRQDSHVLLPWREFMKKTDVINQIKSDYAL